MYNFLYHGVDYEYDSYYCDNESCGCNDGSDYCRCSIYEGLKATDIDLAYIHYNLASKYKMKTLIEKYCLDRIMRINKMYNPELYEVNTSGGYYGEEVDSITFNNEDILVNQITELLSYNTDFEKLMYTLKLEYGYLTETVKEKKTLKIINVSSSDLVPVQNMKKVEVDSYTINNDLPIGVYTEVNDKYHLLDGRHRFLKTGENVNCNIIVLK